MNFDFSEDQKLMQSEVHKFLREQCPTTEVRKVLDVPARHYHEDLWNRIVALGWTATAIPEEFGGLGLGYLELCVIAEEMGRQPGAVRVLLNRALVRLGRLMDRDRGRPALAANMPQANRDVIGPLLDQLLSRQGHIVVRVDPGGERYRALILDDADESMRVKAVHGPYRSR